MPLQSLKIHPENLLLLCKDFEVRYADLADLQQHTQKKLSDISLKKHTIGIQTDDRLQGVLWMVLCWLHNIPFIPFHKNFPEPLQHYRPDVISDQVADIREYLRHRQTANSSARLKHINAIQHPAHYPAHSNFCGLLTSGSSGQPKKVPLSRRQMIAAVHNTLSAGQMPHLDRSRQKYRSKHSGDADETWLRIDTCWGNCLPLYHTGGLTIVFRAFLTGTGIFLWDRFDAGTLCRDLEQHPEIKQISLVPTMLKRMLEYSGTETGTTKNIMHSLETVLVGGGPAPSGLIREAGERGWPAIFSYGMTETCGQIAAQKSDGTSPGNSVGRPFSDHTVTIRDSLDQLVPTGKSGTIRVEGPQVFAGYLPDKHKLTTVSQHSENHNNIPSNRKQTDISDRTLTNPSLQDQSIHDRINTGDIGYLDEEGNLYVEARRTDLIISGGMNIRPAEVEEVLQKCPLVTDGGVTGVPDDEWGHRLTALIVPSIKAGQLSGEKLESEVYDYLSERLKPHQRPKTILKVAEIPRTDLGKIRRGSLLQLATNLLAEK